MGALGIVAGLVTVAGGVALYRFAERKAEQVRDVLEETRRRAAGDRTAGDRTAGDRGGAVLDYERDPQTGVYRPKP